MVDVIKSLDIDYVASNPARASAACTNRCSTTAATRSRNSSPACTRNPRSAIAHGYFKIAGKPLLVLCHGTVGLQHATMAIYNAWCDRVPVIVMGGNDLDAAKRPPGVPTIHAAQDIGSLVRDFTKWDDNPVSLQHFAEVVRARLQDRDDAAAGAGASRRSTPSLQEEPIHGAALRMPRYVPTAPPQGDTNAVREAAGLLVDARASGDRRRSRRAHAERRQAAGRARRSCCNAPVVDQARAHEFPDHASISITPGARARSSGRPTS